MRRAGVLSSHLRAAADDEDGSRGGSAPAAAAASKVDYGAHRHATMRWSGPVGADPLPLTFLDPDRPMDGRLMGVRPVDLATRWLMIDSTYVAQMREKQRLLREPGAAMADILVSLPGASTTAAKRETLRLVADHAVRYFPHIFELRGNVIHNKLLGEDVALDGAEDPLLTAARLVQEDFCLCEEVDGKGVYQLTAGAVFFPMRWSVKEKSGRRMAAVHGPVKAFQRHYLRSFTSFFRALPADAPVARGNWAIFDDLASRTDLHTPEGSVSRTKDNPKPTSAAEAGRKYFYRAEYQTLRRLPETGAVLFSIRTYQHPLEIFAGMPREAAVLAQRIRGLDADMAAYKNAGSWRDWALRYLDTVADPSAPPRGVL